MNSKVNPLHWPKYMALGCIRFYQYIVSPSLPPSCRFFPTCSRYAFEAVDRYGLLKGLFMSVKRIARCHPFSRGGYDPLP